MQAERTRLTKGPVGRHLVAMTVPVLLGIMTMMGQALIDAWFLGRVGDRALAAYAFSFPILMIVTSVAIGLGAGTSSVVARAIGAGDQDRILIVPLKQPTLEIKAKKPRKTARAGHYPRRSALLRTRFRNHPISP